MDRFELEEVLNNTKFHELKAKLEGLGLEGIFGPGKKKVIIIAEAIEAYGKLSLSNVVGSLEEEAVEDNVGTEASESIPEVKGKMPSLPKGLNKEAIRENIENCKLLLQNASGDKRKVLYRKIEALEGKL